MDRLPREVVTPRLTLRLWQRDDVPSLQAAIKASVDHLRPWLAWILFEPLSVEERLQLINSGNADWDNGGDANYGVFHDGVVVGGCGLHRRQGPNTLDLGYWIHSDHVRKGYATELARGLTTAAFEVDGVERVEIHHDKANVASSGIPRSLGFAEGPETRDEAHAPGEVGIDRAWSVTRPDWIAGQRSPVAKRRRR